MMPERQHVAEEDAAAAGERHDAFLDARAGAVVQAMTGAPTFSARSISLWIFGEHLARAPPTRRVLRRQRLAAPPGPTR